MDLYRKLKACLKGEADDEFIRRIYEDVKCLVEKHYREAKTVDGDLEKLKGYLGE